MSSRGPFVVGSVIAHVALAVGLGHIEIKKSRAATAIEIANLPKHEKAPEPAKIDPEPPKPERTKVRSHAAAPPKTAENTPPPQAALAPASEMPDFGFSLAGGVGGDGIALPAGGGAAPALAPVRAAPARKALSSAPSPTSDGCDEPVVKPRPHSVPQPTYTVAAREASIEGKVRVRLTVDENGRVVEVTVIQGLGYGLDEAALAAARAAEFEPATQCGKAVRASFTISMRFSAG